MESIRAVLFLAALLVMHGNVQARDVPNIILILADDLGYGDLSCYGHPTIRTPHLDRMAREGMRFTDFYAAAAVCTPSRAGLLTGRLPIRSGMAGTPERSVAMTYSTGGLPTNEITIASALKKKGYATACIGKWHLGHMPGFLPTNHGFDHFFGVRFANNMEPAKTVERPKEAAAQLAPKREWWRMALLHNESIIEEDTDPHLLTQRYTTEAIGFIKRNKRKPFFLYLAHTYPHTPLFASRKFQGRSARGIYGDTIEELDWSVGEILNALRKQGLDRNTLVFFTSDNGPSLPMKLAGGSAGLFRDGKGTVWEGGIRVPAIAWWPRTIPAETVNRELVSGLDFFNTCLNLAGVATPNDRVIDGVNLTLILKTRDSAVRENIFFYRYDQLAAVRMGHFKAHLGSDGKTVEQLFHLGHDPGETHDVMTEYPEVVTEISRLIEEHNAKLIRGVPQY
jgi:arylsulfatase A